MYGEEESIRFRVFILSVFFVRAFFFSFIYFEALSDRRKKEDSVPYSEVLTNDR